MTLSYHAEYCLGPRGRRVCHTYRGFWAFAAIIMSLALGLAFGLLALVLGVLALALRVVRFVAVTAIRLVAEVLAIPFRLIRWLEGQSQARSRSAKPAWVPLDELA